MPIAWKSTALELVLAAVPQTREIVGHVRREDRPLADQLRRAVSSIALNLAEADGNRGGNRRLRLESARGSAKEALCALRLSVAWGYVEQTDVDEVLEVIERVSMMTWRRMSPRARSRTTTPGVTPSRGSNDPSPNRAGAGVGSGGRPSSGAGTPGARAAPPAIATPHAVARR